MIASIIACIDGERRAQVVARPRDQLAARLEQPLELVRHRVERVGHLGELGRSLLRRRAQVEPPAARPRPLPQPVERRPDPSGRAAAPRSPRGGATLPRRASTSGRRPSRTSPSPRAARRRAAGHGAAARAPAAAAAASAAAAAASGDAMPTASVPSDAMTRARSWRQPVAAAPDRLELARPRGSSSIFARSRRMWTVTVPVSSSEVYPQTRVHQLVAREDAPRVGGEEPEQVELARGQAQRRHRALRPRACAASITRSPTSMRLRDRRRRRARRSTVLHARPARAARTAWSGSRRRPARARRSGRSPRRGAVIMITGRSERARIQRHSASPSMPGSIRSRTTRLGLLARAAAAPRRRRRPRAS